MVRLDPTPPPPVQQDSARPVAEHQQSLARAEDPDWSEPASRPPPILKVMTPPWKLTSTVTKLIS